MFENYLVSYERLMHRTRWISQFSAFMLMIQALFEVISVPIAVSYVENIALDTVWYASVSPVLFLLGFGVRFVSLVFINNPRPLRRTVSWWVAAASVLLAAILTDFRFEHFYFELPFLFPLVTAGYIFLFLGLIRFSITALVAAIPGADV